MYERIAESIIEIDKNFKSKFIKNIVGYFEYKRYKNNINKYEDININDLYGLISLLSEKQFLYENSVAFVKTYPGVETDLYIYHENRYELIFEISDIIKVKLINDSKTYNFELNEFSRKSDCKIAVMIYIIKHLASNIFKYNFTHF